MNNAMRRDLGKILTNTLLFIPESHIKAELDVAM
jgi:hypothetical protein